MALAVFVVGCADETAIMVHVCFESGAAVGVTNVQVAVDSVRLGPASHGFPFPGGATTMDYSLRPGVELSAREDIVLTVIGRDADGNVVVSHSVRTWFEPGVDRDVAVVLELACRHVGCAEPATTCTDGACASPSEASESRCP